MLSVGKSISPKKSFLMLRHLLNAFSSGLLPPLRDNLSARALSVVGENGANAAFLILISTTDQPDF